MKYDYPVPKYLELKNFMSHKHSEIDFGDPNANVFINGASGKGKSAIQRAIQIALGKKITEPNRVFHYTEIDDGSEEKRRKYDQRAQIILHLQNSSINPIATYPKDGIIIIRCEMTQTGVKGNNVDPKKVSQKYFVTGPSGVEERKSISDILLFGNGNDPLIFIPQRETRKNVEVDPKKRFENMERFIGANEYRANVREAVKKLNEANDVYSKANEDLDNAQLQLTFLKNDYDMYFQKIKLEEEIKDISYKMEIAKNFELFDKYTEKEEEFSEIENDRQNTEEEIERIEKRIAEYKDDIEQKQRSTKDKRAELTTIDSKLKPLNAKIYQYEEKTRNLKQKIQGARLDISEFPSEMQNDNDLRDYKEKVDEIKSQRFNLRKSLSDFLTELNRLNKEKKISIPQNTLQLSRELKNEGIPHQILFESLEIDPENENWRKFLETAMGNRRFAIIVEEKDRIKAQKINSQMKIGASLLYGINSLAQNRRPFSDIRSWRKILKIDNREISKQSIIDALDLWFGSNFFATDFDEKEKFLQLHPWIRVFCQDEFVYTNHSQDKVQFVKNHVIGKHAIKLEISRIEAEIQLVKTNLDQLEEEQKKYELQIERNEIINQYYELLKDKVVFENSREEYFKLEEKQQKLNAELAFPEQMLKAVITRLKETEGTLNARIQDLDDIKKNFKSIQEELTQISKDLIGQIKIIVPSIEASSISRQISDEDIQYLAVEIENFKEVLEKFERPTELVLALKYEIDSKSNILNQNYQNITSEIVEKYQSHEKAIETQEKLLEEFSEKLKQSESEFRRTDRLLREKLEEWRKETSENFRKIMNALELNGELIFNKINNIGDYEMNIEVANSIDGALVNYEDSGFSGGEEQRTAVALMISLLHKSNYTYTIWDEFDSEVDESKRELIAQAIKKYLPHRKIIGISPKEMSKGYIKIFPLIFEIWKNQENLSKISPLESENYFGMVQTIDDFS